MAPKDLGKALGPLSREKRKIWKKTGKPSYLVSAGQLARNKCYYVVVLGLLAVGSEEFLCSSTRFLATRNP